MRYAGQVVGGKSENPKVDSVQLRKNVENLLQQIKKIESENEALEKSMTENTALITEPGNVTVTTNEPIPNNPDPNPSEKNQNPKPVEERMKTPNAVMTAPPLGEAIRAQPLLFEELIIRTLRKC